MRLPNQIVCRSCCRPMDAVLTIAPVFGRPSLQAFVCSGCAGTKADVIYPKHWQAMAATHDEVELGNVALR